MKKTASQFVNDLLAGTLPHVPPSATQQAEVAAFAAEIDAHYAFTQAELEAAMSEARGRIEGAIGVAITDEQLVALSGGKSDAARIGEWVAGTLGIAAAGGAVGGAIAGGTIAAIAFAAIK
jgi:hypothetical protein